MGSGWWSSMAKRAWGWGNLSTLIANRWSSSQLVVMYFFNFIGRRMISNWFSSFSRECHSNCTELN